MNASAETPIVFFQMRPTWGLPNASPFCMKLETWLRMVGLPYEARSLSGPPKSSTGKVPYLVRADGSTVADSSVIISTLEREHSVTLDEGLSRSDRAKAAMLQRTFEDSLYFAQLHQRWLVDENWRLTREAYFGTLPALLRATLVPLIRRKVRNAAWGQGIGRMTPEAVERRGIEDIETIAAALGDGPYFLGSEPRTIDAIAYAFLANVVVPPLRSRIADAARAQPNIMSYCDRMRERYWGSEATPEAERAPASQAV